MTNGQVVTGYSYKGGVGRSFALANMAVLLSQWQLRVLCVDWDLEAPGLDYYFSVSAAEQAGLLELVEGVAQDQSVDPLAHVRPVRLRADVTVDLITAGRADETYVSRVQTLDWEGLYAHHDMGNQLEEWRDAWKRRYDVVLIDSRTGVTDIGGICTAQLPDILMLFFTANRQGVDGVLKVRDQAIRARNRLPFDRARLFTVPIPSRIDLAVEYERAEQWRQTFRREFEHCYRDWVVQGTDLGTVMGHTTIPYSAYWSFGEELPALTENPREPSYVTHSLATLAALLVHRLDKTELLATSRDAFVDSAARLGGRRQGFGYDVFISSTPDNAELAETLDRMLSAAGLKVAPRTPVTAIKSWSPETEERLGDSQHLAVLLGDKPTSAQRRESEFVLRQSIDDSSDRRIVPIMTSPDAWRSMPPVLRSLQAYDLTTGSLQEAAHLIGRVVVEGRQGAGPSATPA